MKSALRQVIIIHPRHPEHRGALPVPLGFAAKDLNYVCSYPLGALTVHLAFFISRLKHLGLCSAVERFLAP